MLSARHGLCTEACQWLLAFNLYREGKEGAREGGRNQLLLAHNVIKI